MAIFVDEAFGKEYAPAVAVVVPAGFVVAGKEILFFDFAAEVSLCRKNCLLPVVLALLMVIEIWNVDACVGYVSVVADSDKSLVDFYKVVDVVV